MIRSILVANRGEIARRVFRTARDLGISTVAVYSDADAKAPYVAEADAAVRLPGNAPADTYLRADLTLEAARRTGADAIHPGYGFLSENAAFARAVVEAGLNWIGPPPAAIESMGSKVASKHLMARAGVPVLTGLDPRAVSESDLPVIIKASSGGGGRGMRIVRSLEALPREAALAEAEALSAFADKTVFCEPYLATGRHIEVQIMADQHATVWAVGERECSIQRRHQKVVEEAPSPLVERTPGMREKLFEASRAAASAIGYVGAGTVEFLASDDGRFFFLEMNTRLQVEHPVTECTTGLDLVALQIHVANGGRLDAHPPKASGHSIEARLYAEDPAAGWRPQSGVLHRFGIPGVRSSFEVPSASGIRLDSGVVDGSVVSTHYDPMLAKVISVAKTRDEAAQRLAAALERATIHGLVTNRDLLVRVLRHPAFLAGETDTAFFDTHGLGTLATPLANGNARSLSALAAALADAALNRAKAPVLAGLPSGFRNVLSQPIEKQFSAGSETVDVAYRLTRSGLVAEALPGVALVSASPSEVVLDVECVRRAFRVASYPGFVTVDSAQGSVSLKRTERFPDPSTLVAPGSLLAPSPGVVIRVSVAVGDAVEAGQPLLVLEAMKMHLEVCAPTAGTVAEIGVREGQQIAEGTLLAVIREAGGGKEAA